jgi:D-alanyl-D-alanine carboxypeptidase
MTIMLCVALMAGAARAQASCDGPPAYQPAAAQNAVSLTTLPLSPFGRPETGWEIYAPRIAAEIGTKCAPTTPRFASALARWKASHGIPGEAFDPPTFEAMKAEWQADRPFVAIRKSGACPDAPDLTELVAAGPEESDGGKILLLRPEVLAAYRRMVAAERAQIPEAAADPERLTLFSAFRSPGDDAARCETEANCNGLVRAACSVHRTGQAVDIFLGSAPGFDVDSSEDANRLWISRTATYRWLVANAARYGFVNYVFEPWHWEWVER